MSSNLLQEAAELVCLDTCHSRLDPSEIWLSFFILVIWTAASCHVVGLRDEVHQSAWLMEFRCLWVCIQKCMWSLKSICFLHKHHSRLAAETRWPWLRYGDPQMGQNSWLSCQTPLQSVLLIKHCNNTSFKAWFWWIYLTLYMTGITQSNGITLTWPWSWRAAEGTVLVSAQSCLGALGATEQGKVGKRVSCQLLCQCPPFGNTARAYVLKVK